MAKQSSREDLDHNPDNAGKIGEQHKQANQQGEQPRHGETAERRNQDKQRNQDKP